MTHEEMKAKLAALKATPTVDLSSLSAADLGATTGEYIGDAVTSLMDAGSWCLDFLAAAHTGVQYSIAKRKGLVD